MIYEKEHQKSGKASFKEASLKAEELLNFRKYN